MIGEEFDSEVRHVENMKNSIRFNSYAEELKTSCLVLICKLLYKILRNMK